MYNDPVEKRLISSLLAIAGVGILLLIVISSTFPILNKRLGVPEKKASFGASEVTFLDSAGNAITQTNSPVNQVKLTSPWPLTAMMPMQHEQAYAYDTDVSVLAATAAIFQVKSGADDVNQDGNNFDASSSTVWLGTGQSASGSFTGLRFTNVTIPKGATITSAKIQVRSSQVQWISMRMTMAAEAAGNSQPFTQTSNPSQRILTATQVKHNSNSKWADNTDYNLNEIRSVIQEVVNRVDWQSGNALSLILKGTGSVFGRKYVRSFDGNATNAPKLIVFYDVAAPTSTPAAFTPTPTKVATHTLTPTQIPTATPTPIPVKTSSVVLAEDANFTQNVQTYVYTTHPLIVSYTFSNSNPGTKTLYAKFTASDGQTQVFSSSIDLVATATPTSPPTSGGQNSHALGVWTPKLQTVNGLGFNGKPYDGTNPLDSCTQAQHDAYKVQGPDGKWYPTWHPPLGPGGCRFGHEHGRDPSGTVLWPFIQQTFGYDADGSGTVDGTELATAGVPFAYVNEQLDVYNTANGITGGMRHEDHVGHKIEWENNLQRTWSVNNTAGQPAGIYCDFFMKQHQGTHSKDAFTNNLHEIFYVTACTDGLKVASAKMVAFGTPGGFSEGSVAGGFNTIVVGPATPPSSPIDGPGLRSLPTINRIKQFIWVPSGQFSDFSAGIYEDWISANYITKPDGTEIGYYDPHFAVFLPSRYYWPGSDTNSYGITRTAQDITDNVGRSADVCYMNEGAERASGGECDYMTNYGANPRIYSDDPRSAFNGVHREFYFNNTSVKDFNVGNIRVWYSDPFGRNAVTQPFTGSIKHYLQPWNASVAHPNPFESIAVGATRSYGGSGVHAPN